MQLREGASVFTSDGQEVGEIDRVVIDPVNTEVTPVVVRNGYTIPAHVIKTEKHIPEGEVALKEGARVLSVDGDHVGHVEAILTDVETDRATHLLISKGLFLTKTKLVPTTWISTVLGDEIHLLVSSVCLVTYWHPSPRSKGRSYADLGFYLRWV